MSSPLCCAAPAGAAVSESQASELIARACAGLDYKDRKILLIVPDGTRTAPVGLVFKTLFGIMGAQTQAFDILVALGTHQPISDQAICARLEITEEERASAYRNVRFFNHDWLNPKALTRVGVIPAAEIGQLSGGLFSMDVPVDINRLVFEYDQVIIVGPVFPPRSGWIFRWQQVPLSRH